MLVERRGIALEVLVVGHICPGRCRNLRARQAPGGRSRAEILLYVGGMDAYHIWRQRSKGSRASQHRWSWTWWATVRPAQRLQLPPLEGLGCRFGRSAVSFEHAERARRVGQRLGKRESGGACADYAYVAFKTAPASRGDRVNDAHVLPRPQSRSRSPCPRMGCRSFSSTLATRQPPE